MPDEPSPSRQRLADVLAAAERLMEDPVYRKKVERCKRRRKARAARWESAFWQHIEHPGFAVYDDVYARQFGFVCRCHRGRLRYWPVSMGVFLHASRRSQTARTNAPRVDVVPPAWVRSVGRGTGLHLRPSKDARLNEGRALARAKALLHQFLTREQRWSLRAHGHFRAVGQDGQLYEVGGLRGVRLIVDGRVHTHYCIHPLEEIPSYDVLLAQKLLLETNIELFLSTANAHPVVA